MAAVLGVSAQRRPLVTVILGRKVKAPFDRIGIVLSEGNDARCGSTLLRLALEDVGQERRGARRTQSDDGSEGAKGCLGLIPALVGLIDHLLFLVLSLIFRALSRCRRYERSFNRTCGAIGPVAQSDHA